MGAGALMAGAMGAQALGSGIGALQNASAARTANKRQQDLLSQARGMQISGPSATEQLLTQLFGSMPQNFGEYTPQTVDIARTLGSTGFNAGQDALMQLLRADPTTQVDRALSGILGSGGRPFDLSPTYAALHKADESAINQQISQLTGGAGSLGERFGTSLLGAQTALRRGAATQQGARDAQLAATSYEGAQNRLLGAAQMLTGREQFNTGMQSNIAQFLQQMGLSRLGAESQIGSANNAAIAQALASRMSGLGLQSGILGQLLGGEQARRQFNLSTLGLQGSQTEPYTSPGLGGALGGMGNQLMMWMLLRQMMGGGGGGLSMPMGQLGNANYPTY